MKPRIIIPAIAAVLIAAFIYTTTTGKAEADNAATAAKPVATTPVAPAPVLVNARTSYEQNNIAVYKEASPSVVFVTNSQLQQNLFSLNVMEIPRGAGTGIVWSKSGLIVTNFHVIYRANKITITFQDGNSYDAKIVGTAPSKDIALLRVDAPNETLTPIHVGDSTNLVVGQKVLAIGNPFGLDTTLTVGVVSALGREIKSITGRTIKNVIQTDAAINPGNSGGPLLNSGGQIIGMDTAIYSPSGGSAGIGFAIPVGSIKRIIPQLIKNGRLIRPVLGVEMLSDSWANRLSVKGVPVLAVKPGMPAAKVGIKGLSENSRGNVQLGDVIIAIDGKPVTDEDSLLSQLELHKPGDTVKVTTMRNEKIHNYQVKLAAPN